MRTWLYQMTEPEWPHSEFMRDVMEGRRLVWVVRSIIGKHDPKKGDLVVFAAVGAGYTVGVNLWRWTI